MLVLRNLERKEIKVMTYEKLEILSRIYNTLLLINTKGEDTIVMADCLNAMRSFVMNERQILEKTSKVVSEEV
jgi:hypothetical protein